jgi:outer membrane lipoprotein-sorting protein
MGRVSDSAATPMTPPPACRGESTSRVRAAFCCIVALLLFCIGFRAQAQDASNDLLHNALHQLSQHSAVRAAFTQQRRNPALTQPQTSSGQLLFVTDKGMLWQVQQPYQETLALTGSRTLRIDASGHAQSVRSERGVGQISQMLQSMLAGQLDAVLRQFNVTAEGSAAQWTLHFTPKQSRVAQVLRDIQLDGGAFLQDIRIDMQDGTQTDIHMTDTRDAGPLSALEKQALGVP